MKSASGSGSSTSCSRGGELRDKRAAAAPQAYAAISRHSGGPFAAVSVRLARVATLPNLMLVACVVVAVWFVAVPLSALVYNAFTEDTGFGPGAFSLDNF